MGSIQRRSPARGRQLFPLTEYRRALRLNEASAWRSLDHFVPPQHPGQVFQVTFGTGFSLDQLRFVGACEILVNSTTVEFVGKRLWPSWSRVLAFIVGTPVAFTLITALAYQLLSWQGPSGDVWFGASTRIFLLLLSFVGSPLIVFTIMNYVCFSQSGLRVDHSSITGLLQDGRRVSFLVLLRPGTRRRTRFQAASISEASSICRVLTEGV